MIKRLVLAFSLIITTGHVFADATILPMQERAAVIDRWLTTRVQTVLPELMERADIDMWVIISREYNEDPVIRTMIPATWHSARRRTILLVIRTMIPATWHSARRRTILLIYNPGDGQSLETLAVARYAVGDMFEKAWDRELHGEQWARLAEVIKERNPRRIGLNYSETFALADGISQTEYRLFHEALDPDLHDRVVSAEKLAIGWLETRTEEEMATYQNIVRIAHEILRRAIRKGYSTWNYYDRRCHLVVSRSYPRTQANDLVSSFGIS